MNINLSPEFRVNTIVEGQQNYPSILALSGGGFVVTWEDGSETAGDLSDDAIRAQVFDASGEPVGHEFLVNQQTDDSQRAPKLAELANGDFVIAWEDYNGLPGSEGLPCIKARIFGSDGTPKGDEFVVNETTADSQWGIDIAGRSDGSFVVAWSDESGLGGDPDGSSVKARLFNADGTPQAGEFLVNHETKEWQFYPEIAVFDDGGFVITWYDDSGELGDNDGSAVSARFFDANGAAVDTDFLVNSETDGDQYNATIARLEKGGFVIVWDSSQSTLGDGSGQAIHARIFDDNGVPTGGDILVNAETSGSQYRPSVTALEGGRFVVTWVDYSQQLGDTSSSGIVARIFDADGTPLTGDFLVNTFTHSQQEVPEIAALAGGGFVVTWRDSSLALGEESTGIKATVFNAEGQPIVPFVGAPLAIEEGSNSADVLTGTSGSDALFGYSGKDKLIGNNGRDVLDGGGGNDTLKGGGGDDVLIGGAGRDVLDGGAGRDMADYAGDLRVTVDLGKKGFQNTGHGKDKLKNIEDLAGGSANDVLKGNGKANLLIGREGNDKLIGRGGADTLEGGAGNDVLKGGGGKDRLEGGEGIDILVGGGGADAFVFTSPDDSGTGKGNRDVIRDFGKGADVLDFSGFDIDPLEGGVQGLTLIGDAAFSGTAGELRFETKKKFTLVQVDVDGDGNKDFEIELKGKHNLEIGDFLTVDPDGFSM